MDDTPTGAAAGSGWDGRIREGRHRFPVRVYWEDTDAGGVVYYANYLRFAERARTEMLRLVGIDQSRLMDDAGVTFAVRRCTVDYRAPARLDDQLEVATAIASVSGASLSMTQKVTRAETDLVRLEVDIACIGPGGRPARLPHEIRRALSDLVPSPVPVT